MKSVLIIILILGSVALLVVILINLQVTSYSTDRIYDDINNVPAKDRVAIVLGARVGNDGVPSNTLYDRTVTGVELYKAGKTRKLVFSGGNNEPEVMKKLAIDLGVPETDVVLDDLGMRTYDSCIRAKQVFAIEKAIIVTQDYHLARSIYLCQTLDVDAIGLNAKRRDYDGERYAWLREYIARVVAWYDINFEPLPPEPSDKRPIGP
ncbi:MAG: ElyC/SanA/YdcF family protein [Pyrinomonadaceae bacterium]